MFRRFVIPALTAVLLLPTLLHADAIDQVVAAEMQRQHSPAIGIAVVKDGQVVKEKGYGIANLEHGVPATEKTFFQTASMGKQFAATLVMLLVRDGKLRLDEPITSYLPGAPEAWRKITLRHLLTHTSGLRDDEKIDLHKDYTEQELLASAYQVPLAGPPGQEFFYSNLGYQLIGFICSRVGGKFYGDQLRERLFQPLGMSARIISERDITPGRAAGYERFDGVFGNQDWVSPSLNTTADGSLYVNADDMARWSRALDAHTILTKAEQEAMWTPAVLNDGQRTDYGFGWELNTEAGHRLVRHSGAWQGFRTYLLHLPDDRLTVTVLMNRSGAQPEVIANQIAAIYFPELAKKPLPVPSAQALARTRLFIRGSMNDWQATAPLTEVQPGRLQARVRLDAGMQQFKVGDADWKLADFGARFDEELVKSRVTKPLEFHGGNLMLEVTAPGDYTFQLDLAGKEGPVLTVTFEAGQ